MVGSMDCTNSLFHRERELLMIYTKPVYTLLNNLEVKVQEIQFFFLYQIIMLVLMTEHELHFLII